MFLWLGRGDLFGVNMPFILAVFVTLAGLFALNRTTLGLHALAVGGREEAARVMGLAIGRIKIAVYGISRPRLRSGASMIAARLSEWLAERGGKP